MIDEARAVVNRQVARVRRRLLLQVAIDSMIIALASAFLAAMIWFLVRPFAFGTSSEQVRWGVPLGALGLGGVSALVLAWLRRPSLIDSSLTLDERFGLQERVTTFLSLTERAIDSPAGQALLKDVQNRLASLQISSAIPVRLSWKQIAAPAGALALAFGAFLLDPILGELKFGSSANADTPRRVIDAAKIQEKLDEMKKNVAERAKEEKPKSEELKKMEEEFAKLLNQPLDPKNEDKIKERVNEFRNLQEKMKERMEAIREKAEKIDALKKQLEKLGLEKDKLVKDGPAKDFQDALIKGDLDKAKVALENLAKDLKNNKLDEKQRKELAEQFQKLQEQMKKVMDEDQFVKKLQQDLKDGKINKEEFANQLQNFQHLQDLTNVLGECKECLGRGDPSNAGEKLEEALKQFGGIELTEAEIRDLLRDQGEVRGALNLLEEALEDPEEGEGGGGRPGGRRRAGGDFDTKPIDARSPAELNPKSPMRVTGHARGGTFNKIPANAVPGAFQQAAQEAPEALDRQRVPDDARPIFSGYFNRLGNQK